VKEKRNIKTKINKMFTDIKKANIYHFEPIAPTQKSLEIRKLIEYSKVTNFKKGN
tara:strand:- start:190 stop:354 length:165 start_codon:yes stop_codon:yes gene_type:complete